MNWMTSDAITFVVIGTVAVTEFWMGIEGAPAWQWVSLPIIAGIGLAVMKRYTSEPGEAP